ncbi:MAG: hypothetical protein A2W93_01680 [Bacteroidetes bacterium GWF2_43_63]|nr:MAG: hypothetical protein A2W94_10395 [Bacteroidetes bacterium GWE2_42_42]OFY55778.1 MAG: hypothetical protein A2W93_01680 [Bacteroidetes bacterium GWF2_43_63]HBG71306.1 hypothetical protein [Bacteroidales bacterium]HCB60473.1 hypothetical protein [Bacteroidales bacterium]HCY22570.1 hypothetical protein [Bacteroidales bacterium]
MQKTLTIVYTIATAALAIILTIMHLQPARALINVFTTYDGREYYIAPVVLITWLILLLPMLLVILISKMLRVKKDDEIIPGKTGIIVMRQKAFQSAMVGIPIFINGAKAGVIDNGKRKFFEVPAGSVTIVAGTGKQASESQQIIISEGQNARFFLQFIQVGLGLKCLLIPL